MGTGARQAKVPGCKTDAGAHSQGHAWASLNFVSCAPHLHHPRPGSVVRRGRGGEEENFYPSQRATSRIFSKINRVGTLICQS